MNVKIPLVIDTSYWEVVPDWGKIKPRPALGITKATEGDFYRDGTFPEYWASMKANGIPRMAYHFHRKAIRESEQARYFTDYLSQFGVTHDDIFALDVEEGGESAAKIIEWLDAVERVYSNRIIIYSRKNILDNITTAIPTPHPIWDLIPMTDAQKTRLKKYPTWTAGYPPNPDIYTTVPNFYVPDQTKWGPVALWQYTDKGVIEGVYGNVDLNLISVWFFATLPNTTPPPADSITTPYAGMTRVSGKRYGWQFELFVSDPVKVNFEVVYCVPLETVSSVSRRKSATLAVNGGEWDRVANTKDYTVTNELVIIPRVQPVPSIMIMRDNSVRIDHRLTANVEHAISGLRYLIQGGVVDPLLSGTEAKYTEGHSRSVHGVTADGKHMVLQSEGAYPNQGLTLKQAAQLMKDYGAVTAFDSGAGGDMTCILDGRSLIIPENPGGYERYLPSVFLIYTKEGNTMPNTCVSHTHNLSLRPLHQTKDSSTILSIPVNTVLTVIELWIAPETTPLNNKGDQWAQVAYSGQTGWVGLIHLGQVYGVYTPGDVTPTVSPVSKLMIDQDFQTKSLTITRLRIDGTSEVTHDPIV